MIASGIEKKLFSRHSTGLLSKLPPFPEDAIRARKYHTAAVKESIFQPSQLLFTAEN